MKLLLVTPLLPHPRAMNGGELVKYEQIRRLAGAHGVTLLSFVRPEDAAEAEAIARLRALGVRLETVPRPLPAGMAGVARRLGLAARWAFGAAPLRALAFADGAMQARIDALLAAEAFDLIHVWDNAMGAYEYRGAAPTVLTEQEVITEAVGGRGAARLLERGRWRRHQAAVWRRFDQVEVFTPRDAAAVRALVPEMAERVTVNPFGGEIPEASRPDRETPGLVTFVGGFLHAPNVDAAVWLARDVMPRIWARHPSARLEIVGSYAPRRVRALASARIAVTGRVPGVEPYLERAAVVLAPMRTGGGMRVKVLQAMAMGKAVVTTPLGAEGLAAWPAGTEPVAVARDAAGLADAAVHLLSDPTARRALGDRARAFVAEHHSWEAYARRLDEIHRRALRRPGDAKRSAECAR